MHTSAPFLLDESNALVNDMDNVVDERKTISKWRRWLRT